MMALGSERLHHIPQMPIGGNYLKHVPIAPANHSAMDGPRHNKRYVYANKPYGGIETNPSVIRRNARERNRVKQVNNGFVSLRQHIPQAIVADLSNGKRTGGSKKLSKVDTLRMAVEYIRRLKSLLDGDQDQDSNDAASSISFNSQSSAEASADEVHQSSPNEIDEFSYYNQHQNYENYYVTPSSACQDTALISPTSSSYSDGYYSSTDQVPKTQIKFENSFDDYNNTTEDEELLDYISLWQEDM